MVCSVISSISAITVLGFLSLNDSKMNPIFHYSTHFLCPLFKNDPAVLNNSFWMTKSELAWVNGNKVLQIMSLGSWWVHNPSIIAIALCHNDNSSFRSIDFFTEVEVGYVPFPNTSTERVNVSLLLHIYVPSILFFSPWFLNVKFIHFLI